jgi:hypothetical protein
MTTVSNEVTLGRQVLRQEVNRRIRSGTGSGTEANGSGTIEIFCECGRVRCADRLRIALDDYDDVLASRGNFVVTTHHDHDATQRLVSRHHGFLVVEREYR